MKRIKCLVVMAMVISLFVVCGLCQTAQAAGSTWVDCGSVTTANGNFTQCLRFVADDATGAIPAWPYTGLRAINSFQGCIQGIEYLPSAGATKPDSFVFALNTPGGTPLTSTFPVTIVNQGWIKAMNDGEPLCISGGLSATSTGNTVVSATGTLMIRGFGRDK